MDKALLLIQDTSYLSLIDTSAERLPQLLLQSMAFLYQQHAVSSLNLTSSMTSNNTNASTISFIEFYSREISLISMITSLISSSIACTSCLMSIREWYKKCTLVNYLAEKKSQPKMNCSMEYKKSCETFEHQLSGTGEYFKTNYLLLVVVFLAYLLNISARVGFILLQVMIVFALPIHVVWRCAILLVINLIRFGFVREDKTTSVLFSDPFHRYHTLLFYYPLMFSNHKSSNHGKIKGINEKRCLLVCSQFFVDFFTTLVFLLIFYNFVKSIQSSILVYYLIASFFFFFLFFISILIQACIANMFAKSDFSYFLNNNYPINK